MSESHLLRHFSTETRTKLDETSRLRDRAVAVLKSLQDAKRRCDRQLTQTNRTDAMVQVTGRSALDEAIASAKRTIDVLDRAASEALRENAVPEMAVAGGRVCEREVSVY